MTEEKKSKIRKIIVGIVMGSLVLLIGYLIYGIATKTLNTTMFNILACVVVVINIVMCDIVEPYLTGRFKEIDAYQRDAYKKFLFYDVVSMAGILGFVLSVFSNGAFLVSVCALLLYTTGGRKKKTYQEIFRGRVTKDDVEAAKTAAEEE